MIRDLTFGGNYRDELFTMEAMLVTPAEYGYAADDVLIFEVHITTRGITPKLSEWYFYMM